MSAPKEGGVKMLTWLTKGEWGVWQMLILADKEGRRVLAYVDNTDKSAVKWAKQ